MTETNSPETPETFADAIKKLRTFGAWQDNDRINAVVTAHEREVEAMAGIAGAHWKELCEARKTIAELKEALRKIANDKGTGCVIARCPFANDDSVYCEYCTNSAGEVARAALGKTNA